nr:extracellular solute-binding protein [Brachybacterium fresconis]
MGLAGAGTLAGCTRESPADAAAPGTLRMRVWDDAAASAYEASLEAFTRKTGIAVEVEVMVWDDYWKQLPLDVADEALPDVLWMNTANLAGIQAGGQLLELGGIVGDQASQWEETATDLYRIDDALWGVPQIWDQSILLAHHDLVAGADGDASALTFDPGAPSDPLRELARKITVDGEGLHPGDEGFDAASRAVFGFGSHPDRTAVLGPFIAAQGGTWQDEEGHFAFASSEGVSAVQYLADLAADHLAPAGAETVADEQLCQSLFLEGKLGLLQTGTYDLHTVREGIADSFDWSVHPVVAGSEGPRPLVHAVAALGVDPGDEDRAADIEKLLAWLGSADGQRPLAENLLGIPAHRELHGTWQKAWEAAGVDVSALATVPDEPALPERGNRSAEGTGAALAIIGQIFQGKESAEEALPTAQQKARAARH